MPEITIELLEGRTLEQKRGLVKEMTDVVVRNCGVRPEDVTGFTIQTIVEGSDATVDSDLFTFPVKTAAVDKWIKDMEAEAARLWEAANADDEADSD